MRTNHIYLGLVLFIGLTLFGCGKDGVERVFIADPNLQIEPDGTEMYLNQGSEVIFDQEKLHRFDITLSGANLQFLDNDPTAEEYVAGSMTYNGETISPVGVRYKGSIGAFVNCVFNSNLNNPSGVKTCTKLSMKIKINWEGREDRFYGLKKIQLHSQNLDPSQLRERLGYWIFAQMDVPAPRSVHAEVYINGTYQGLYALTEQIDGRLTRSRFADGEGNLYKEVWPIDIYGNPKSQAAYLDGLKTNEDENPNVALIRSFAEEISNASEDDVKEVLDKWMDMDRTIAMAAVDRTIRHDDGPFHWYCSGGGCENHNFYWYEETDIQKLHLIPWDMDNAFENIRFDINPVTPVRDKWNVISDNCQPFTYGLYGLQQRSAACDKIIKGWTLYDTEYEAKRTHIKTNVLEASSINARIDQWAAQIEEATERAASLHDDSVTMASWRSAVDELKSALDHARRN